MTKRKALLFIGALLVIGFMVACDAYSDLILGNREHGVPCADLPTRAQVDTILRERAAVVERITRVRTINVIVEVGEPCPGKADLVIYYPDRAARREIEKIIGAETFFGVPYRLINILAETPKAVVHPKNGGL
jgi:hypothetical protein